MSFRGLNTYLDLYCALRRRNNLRDFEHLFEVLRTNSDTLCTKNQEDLKKWCRSFCYRIYPKWSQVGRSEEKFLKKYSDWLQTEIQWSNVLKENIAPLQEIVPINTVEEVIADHTISPSKLDSSTSTHASTSFHHKSFEDLGYRQKKRRTEDLRKCYSIDELMFSTESSLRAAGKIDEADILQFLIENPTEASKIKQIISGRSTTYPPIKDITPPKALALYVSLDLSKWRYMILRDFHVKEEVANYPSYYTLLKEKKKCYPKKEQLIITASSAKIQLQALLDITTQRLIKSQNIHTTEEKNLVLVSKWGFDGSSNQSVYNQKTSEAEETDFTTVFAVSLVPIRLTSESGDIIWQNDRPSSTSLCRPILIKFIKETEENVKREMTEIEEEIQCLQPTKSDNVSIKHELHLTMIDGKIHSYISGTAASVCDICKARPSEMNDIEKVRSQPVNEHMFKYGLSSLHAWIRTMECCLHIAYKLDIKAWQAKGDEAKKKVTERKTIIQKAFRKETGLLLDVVKQGAGTTNTGNCARRFFDNPDKSAELTGRDERLVRKLAVILQCISSGEKNHLDKFRDFCNVTALLYVQLYPWYYMPASLHKLLIHGPDIIENFSVMPIGFLSEEASEARNKEFRKYRENRSRKHSSVSCNEDVLHNLLLSSDPLLTSMRPVYNTFIKRSSFSEFYELTISKDNIDFVDVNESAEFDSEAEVINDHDCEYDDDNK